MELYIRTVQFRDRDGNPFFSRVKPVTADTNLTPDEARGFPDVFKGTLRDLTPTLFNEIKTDGGVQISFGGKSYTFSRLEKNGTFELRKDW